MYSSTELNLSQLSSKFNFYEIVPQNMSLIFGFIKGIQYKLVARTQNLESEMRGSPLILDILWNR